MFSHRKDWLTSLKTSHRNLWSNPLKTTSLWLLTVILLTFLLLSRSLTNSWEKDVIQRTDQHLPKTSLVLTQLPKNWHLKTTNTQDKSSRQETVTTKNLQDLPGLVSYQKTDWSQLLFGKAQPDWLPAGQSLPLYLLRFRDQASLNHAKSQLKANKSKQHFLLKKQDSLMAILFATQGLGAVVFVLLALLFMGAHFFMRRFLLPPVKTLEKNHLLVVYLWLALETALGAVVLTQGLILLINHSPLRPAFLLTLNATLIPYAILVASLSSLSLYAYHRKVIKKEARPLFSYKILSNSSRTAVGQTLDCTSPMCFFRNKNMAIRD
ncbi:hypothetical protein [Streptococcus sp. DD12]|uniref:hypothetical protein n=1 Tax=Streptococcus sp. DD12 TaxID=1777880 RepID=UPI000834F777|nr:hypothetical protein [Streptococcus sp. DD12]